MEMIKRILKGQMSRNGCQIVQIKRTDVSNPKWLTYEQVIDDDGIESYIPYADLEQECTLFYAGFNTANQPYIKRMDIAKAYVQLSENQAISKHVYLQKASENADYTAHTGIYFWKCTSGAWNKTNNFVPHDNMAEKISALIGKELPTAKSVCGESYNDYMAKQNAENAAKARQFAQEKLDAKNAR